MVPLHLTPERPPLAWRSHAPAWEPTGLGARLPGDAGTLPGATRHQVLLRAPGPTDGDQGSPQGRGSQLGSPQLAGAWRAVAVATSDSSRPETESERLGMYIKELRPTPEGDLAIVLNQRCALRQDGVGGEGLGRQVGQHRRRAGSTPATSGRTPGSMWALQGARGEERGSGTS